MQASTSTMQCITVAPPSMEFLENCAAGCQISSDQNHWNKIRIHPELLKFSGNKHLKLTFCYFEMLVLRTQYITYIFRFTLAVYFEHVEHCIEFTDRVPINSRTNISLLFTSHNGAGDKSFLSNSLSKFQCCRAGFLGGWQLMICNNEF